VTMVTPRSGIIPNRFVRCRASQARLEHPHGPREYFPEAAHELGREIRVKQELQRDLRSRPGLGGIGIDGREVGLFQARVIA